MNGSLESSNRAINRSTNDLLVSLNEKLADPLTSVKAGIWQPKALLIMNMSKGLYDYIDKLKSEIKNEAVKKRVDGKEVFNERDKKVVKRLFIIKGKGAELQKLLKRYNEGMFSVHPHLDSVFMHVLAISVWDFDSAEEKNMTVIKKYFADMPAIAALAMLSKLQNDVKVAENSMVQFCNNKISTPGWGWDTYSAVIGQSSSAVTAGEKIEIIAGVGAFSVTSKPEIFIRHKKISIGTEGTAIYKFRASAKPGKHYVPVRISFTDQDGKQQTIEKNVEYTVIQEPCPAK